MRLARLTIPITFVPPESEQNSSYPTNNRYGRTMRVLSRRSKAPAPQPGLFFSPQQREIIERQEGIGCRAPNGSSQSSGVAVEVAGLGNILHLPAASFSQYPHRPAHREARVFCRRSRLRLDARPGYIGGRCTNLGPQNAKCSEKFGPSCNSSIIHRNRRITFAGLVEKTLLRCAVAT
jgi:hypothetical protein